MPPPSGTTEAEEAKAPETAGVDVASKADSTPVVGQEEGEGDEEGEEESAEIEHPHGTLEPAVAGTGHTGEDGSNTKALEEHGGLEASKNDRTPKADNTEEDKEDDEAEAQETRLEKCIVQRLRKRRNCQARRLKSKEPLKGRRRGSVLEIKGG